jgi:hypothetical protein
VVPSCEGDTWGVQVQRALGVAGGRGGQWRRRCCDGQGGRVFGLGDALLDLREGLLLALAKPLQLLCDAVLDFQFQGFRAGGIGLLGWVGCEFLVPFTWLLVQWCAYL